MRGDQAFFASVVAHIERRSLSNIQRAAGLAQPQRIGVSWLAGSLSGLLEDASMLTLAM